MKNKIIRYILVVVPFVGLVVTALYMQRNITSSVTIGNGFIEQIYFLISFLILPCILAPISEEIGFRGFLVYRKNLNIASVSIIVMIIETIAILYNQTNYFLNLTYSIGNILTIKLGFLPEIILYIILRNVGLAYILIAVIIFRLLSKKINTVFSKLQIGSNNFIITILPLSTLLFTLGHFSVFHSYISLLYYIFFGLYLSFIAYNFSLKMSIYAHSLINLTLILLNSEVFSYILDNYVIYTIIAIFSTLLIFLIKKELNKLALSN